jgi:hypothetical protein
MCHWGRKASMPILAYHENEQRTHAGIEASPPAVKGGAAPAPVASLERYRWQKQRGGLFQLPVAA